MTRLGRHRRREIGWDLETCRDIPVQHQGDASFVQISGKPYVGKGRSIPTGGFAYVCEFRGKPAVMLANGTALRLRRSKLKGA